jgi:hypothetical protein
LSHGGNIATTTTTTATRPNRAICALDSSTRGSSAQDLYCRRDPSSSSPSWPKDPPRMDKNASSTRQCKWVPFIQLPCIRSCRPILSHRELTRIDSSQKLKENIDRAPLWLVMGRVNS